MGPRPVALLLSLALLVHASGCVKRKIERALEKETRASLTVHGDPAVVAIVERQLNRIYKVQATVETIEKGVTILKIIGAYAAVVDAIVWLIKQNLKLLANDEVSKNLLGVALTALK